jgi:serine/threonine protein kinase
VSEDRPIPFGKYELLERLGAGGMAQVFRARYTAAPGVIKPVVIKRVLSQFAENPAFVEMFIQEARISVGFNHGNIVQVFDFGQVDGEYFLAMELVEGQPLSRVLKRAKAQGLKWLPAPLAVQIAIEMCKGLHHAHTRTDERGKPLGVVHRDISPDNVLVSYEGEVKISDFGIAKAQLAGRVETEAGTVKGKYLYVSPEQARGVALDARSDVYSVGVVLYRMLCGQLPAEGQDLQVLERVVRGDLTSPLALNKDLDDSLVLILQRALATDRAGRPESAQALQQELARWLAKRAPLFAPGNLRYLMEWLYTQELLALGRSPVLPQEFREQVALWGGTPIVTEASARPASVEELAAEIRGPASARSTLLTNIAERLQPSRGLGWGLFAVALSLALVIGFMTVSRPSPLEIHSEPSGAQVRIDGIILGATPLVTEDVDRSKPHHVELFLLGWQPWSRTFEAGTLDARLDVNLEGASAPAPEPAPALAPTEPLAPAPALEAERQRPASPPPPSRSGLKITASAKPSPAVAEQKYKQGLEQLKKGRLSSAKDLFWECLANDPKAARCFLRLGEVSARMGNTDEAVAHYRRYLELAPKGPGARQAHDFVLEHGLEVGK